jgi:hypothetical protein
MFRQLQQEGRYVPQILLLPFLQVLSACASILALEEGTFLGEQIIQSRWDSDG